MPQLNVDQFTGGDGMLIDPAGWPPLSCEKLITFAGATTDAWGDDGGVRDGGAVFKVTGVVRVRLLALCKVNLAGAVTLEAGVASGTALLIAQIADATGIDAGEFWFAADAPTTAIAPTSAAEKVIASDIILTYGGNITAGALEFNASWAPVSPDGLLVPSAL